jgi:crotonobetainyl-CoA:carnitine CoA-transferase CaiB-like acyl-CoA transferase
MCNKEKFWGVLAHCIGKPEWADAPQYRTFKDRLAHRDRLTEELDAVLQAQTTGEWMKRFAGKVPAAPVYDVAQALESDFVAEQQRVLEFDHAGGPVRMVASPVRAGPHPMQAAPAMGEHTEQILRQAGYTENQVADLRNAGVI